MVKVALGVPEDTQPKTWFTYPLTVDSGDLWSVHVIGQPGFGKSTLLGNLAEAFADAGEGVFLIDVKGDLARNVAARTKHPDRLVYIDLLAAANDGHYWALNPLDFNRDDARQFEFYANALPELFARIGPFNPEIMQRINKILSEGIRLALAKRGTTLTDIYLIAHDERFRRDLLTRPNVPPLTYDYWTNVFPRTERDQRGMVESTDSRLRDIMNGPYLSFMLNQPESTLKFREWLDAGKLVVVNIDQKLGATTARKIGNLFIGHLYNEIIQRPTGQTAPPWRLIIDEATELATKPFAELITQMRTYSAYPVFAHQNRAQLDKEPDLKAAAEQASVKVELQLSEADADLMKRRRGETDVDQSDIGAYRAVVSLTKRPAGSPRRQTVLLLPWQEEVKPGQLEKALAHQLTLCQHKSQLRTLFDFDRFQRGAAGGTHEPRQRPSKHDAPSPPPLPRSAARQTASERTDQPDVSGADGDQQAPVSQELADSRSALPGPPQRLGTSPINRGKRQGGERRLPD